MTATTQKIAPAEGLGEDKEKKEVTLKDNLLKFVDGRLMGLVMALLTVYALVGDDIRLLAFNKEHDSFFNALSSIALVMFFIEFCINSYAKPEYACGFYFILDGISTLSLIPDIGWIWEPLVGSEEDAGSTATLKAGRASRAGTKAGRIVRIVRLVRMVRIVRLYKMRAKKEEMEMENISEPSKVGKKLTELTTRRLIILVVTMIIVLPFLDGSLDQDYNEFQEYGLQSLHHYTQDYNASQTVERSELQDMVLMYARNAGPLLSFKVHDVDESQMELWLREMRFQSLTAAGTEFDTSTAFDKVQNPLNQWHFDKIISDVKGNYRSSEYTVLESSGCYNEQGQCIDCESSASSCMSYAYFDTKADSQASAGINIVKTIFIMVILSVGAIMFTRDAQTLVIGPIERMMDLVNKLAENPLASTKTEKKSYEDDEPQGDYETSMLEETLSKIGGLLQVGFGVAGTEIIAKNMGGKGELNVMIAGKKITSVFGFGIIEGFTEMCSVLEENIIMYINTIANIVHSDTNSYYGAANKNIGSAFLLAWKICDGPLPGLRDPRDTGTDRMDDATKAKERASISMKGQGDGRGFRDITPQEIVDSALTAVLKMRINIHNANRKPNGVFRQFCDNPRVQSTFGPDFEVHLGFGLHIGWAIEGAIGSKYKIDASYLSPNVNMAARLEAATGQFDVPMLISEWFVGELSPGARDLCRKIDRVTVKGSAIPMELWTYDIGSYPSEGLVPLMDKDGRQIRIDFSTDKRCRQLREGIDPDFFSRFEKGVEDYLAGNWPAAKENFKMCQKLYEKDGPTKLLLRILEEKNFAAPDTWPGYRELTEK